MSTLPGSTAQNGSGPTLSAIGISLATGLVIGSASFLAFGWAVARRSPIIAPRCTARPKQTIYTRDPRDISQNRGNPVTGWIAWVMNLSFDTMLEGIPGTGTRKKGIEGRMLNVNLDGVVMLRFHHIGFKVTLLITFLALCIILPINLTANCYSGGEFVDYCVNPSNVTQNLTDFERTTIANIPPVTNSSSTAIFSIPILTTAIWFGHGYGRILIRFYVIAFCSWIVYWYACSLLGNEWHEVLALRRVFYLENEIWERRKKELEETIENQESSLCSSKSDADEEEQGENEPDAELDPLVREEAEQIVVSSAPKERGIFHSLSFLLKYGGLKTDDDRKQKAPGAVETLTDFQKRQRRREKLGKVKKRLKNPWIYDPEIRDTLPNIELYSVLVGNIPTLPSEVIGSSDVEAAMEFSPEQAIDWQRSVVSAFFDQCVPNQPGFSSSVAAVTILPHASDLALAWRKWFVAAAALRRLRFLRSLIANLDAEKGDGNSGGNGAPEIDTFSNRGSSSGRLIFGGVDCMRIEEELFEALGYGPEQAAVYSREYAQAAFGCCPFGRNENRLRRTRELDILLDLEKETLGQLYDAHKNLRVAREKAKVGNISAPPSDVGGSPRSPRNFPRLSEVETVSNNDLSSESPLRQTMTDYSKMQETEVYLFERAMEAKTPPRRNTSRDPIESQAEEKVSYAEEESSPSMADSNVAAIEEKNLEKIPTPTNRLLEDFSGSQSFRRLKPANMSANSNESAVVMDSEGRFFLKDRGVVVNFLSLHPSDDVGEAERGSQIAKKLGRARQPPTHNPPVGESGDSKNSKTEPGDRWRRAGEIRRLNNDSFDLRPSDDALNDPPVDDGVWLGPADVLHQGNKIKDWMLNFWSRTKSWCRKAEGEVEDSFTSKSTFAVVTFTSRQAAVAARHCLADGRGRNRWISYEPLPVPPLADSASCDLVTCRGCCRPVTVNLIPFTFVQSLIQPAKLEEFFPGLAGLYNNNRALYNMTIGLIPGALYSLFLSFLPLVFKAVANSRGDETSIATAEGSALRYYWWFMLITAFTAAYIATTVIQASQTGDLQLTTQEFLINIANTLPTQTSFGWLNWLIFRFGITLPSQYMLQSNVFLFHFLGWKCCKRMETGGMNGPDVPYRIYVDSGAAFLFAVALSFTSPLVAPAALLYYMLAIPLMRRNCIYIYRPRYDGGGFRWPFLFDIFISSMVVAQVLLTLILLLKEAVGCAIVAILPLPATLIFRHRCRKQFLNSFLDAGLLQTSLLDGWDTSTPTSVEKREEFRRFLVDAHKAAYVPVCIAGDTVSVLTVEHAAVVPLEYDDPRP